MPVIVHGDNKGIAVDGNLTIKELDFQFGTGVVAARSVKQDVPEVEDAVVIEDEKPAGNAKKVYPEVTDVQRNFFESAFTISGDMRGRAPRVVEMPVELIMHTVHDVTEKWNPVNSKSVRKWKILYEVLRRLRYFRIEEKQRYRDFVEAVVRYCFPSVDGSYNNNISKSPLDVSFEYWDLKDKDLYKELKRILTFE